MKTVVFMCNSTTSYLYLVYGMMPEVIDLCILEIEICGGSCSNDNHNKNTYIFHWFQEDFEGPRDHLQT